MQRQPVQPMDSRSTPRASSSPRGSSTTRAQHPTPRTQCPTPRAQRPTPRTQCPTPRAGSYTKHSLAFRPNPDPMQNISSPKPSTFEAALRLQFLFGSSEQELHHSQAKVWRRPLKSPSSLERLSFWLRIGIQAHRDTRAHLQKPPNMEPNEERS